MRRYLSYLSMFVWGLLWTSPVNATSPTELLEEAPQKTAQYTSDKYEDYSYPEIFNLWGTMKFSQQQEFCENIKEARKKVSEALFPNLGPVEIFGISLEDVSDLVDMYQKNPKDLEPFFEYKICDINFKPLTVNKYLEFCLDLDPPSTQDVETILGNLELSADLKDPSVPHLVRSLKTYLTFPFGLSPSDMIGFSETFEGLKRRETKEPSILEQELTSRQIANYILRLNLEEKKEFCQKLSGVNDILRHNLWMHSFPRNCLNCGEEQVSLSTIKDIVKAMDSFWRALKPIRDFKLWTDDHERKVLTLGKFLNFYVAMNPKTEEQMWIPCVQRSRSVHNEKILWRLDLSTNGHKDETIQKRIRSLQDRMGDPFSFYPLKINRLKVGYEKLKSAVKVYKRPAFVMEDDLEAWIRNHPVLIGAMVSAASIAFYTF